MEAIAAQSGFEFQGGNRYFSPHATGSASSIAPSTKALRFSFTKKTAGGFYLRAGELVQWGESCGRGPCEGQLRWQGPSRPAARRVVPFPAAGPGGQVHQIEYRDSRPLRLSSRCISAPERLRNALFSDSRAQNRSADRDAAPDRGASRNWKNSGSIVNGLRGKR
jgi:hypothetical protein